jgi:hypothetical protein
MGLAWDPNYSHFGAKEVLTDEVKAGLARLKRSRELWTSRGSKLPIRA